MMNHSLGSKFLDHPDRQVFITLQHHSAQNTAQKDGVVFNNSNLFFFAPFGIFLLVLLISRIPWKQLYLNYELDSPQVLTSKSDELP